jgi:hypothetical protein
VKDGLRRTDTLIKTSIVVHAAWEIGENDQDIIGITEDDPIIPPGVADPPVLKVLARRKPK